MKNVEYLEAFSSYLHEEDKSTHTINGYVSDVKDFMSFIKKDLKKIKKNDVSAFKDHLRQRKCQVLTINRKLIGVKQFIDFINDRYELNVSVRVKQEKVQKQYSLNDEELLTQKDFELLIKTVEEAGDIRAKALFETMAYSGMRISEALQLRVDHLENGIESKVIVINNIKGKGGKYRDIYLNEDLIKSLNEYLKVRKIPFSSTPNEHKELFLGQRGPLTRKNADILIKKYAKLAGIEVSKAHVHNLRHLFGLNLAAEGMPIEEIAQLMGHASIDVTKIYLTKPQSYFKDRINNLSFISKRKSS
jgi:integrase/recombinase XerD